jgi:hypothetical protein
MRLAARRQRGRGLGAGTVAAIVASSAASFAFACSSPSATTCDGGCIDAAVDGFADGSTDGSADGSSSDGSHDGPGGPSLRIATFGPTRAPGYSLSGGSSSTRVRAALEQFFPIVWVPVASLESLDATKADGALLSSWASSFSPLDPISGAEQVALRAFVENGRFVVLLLDNDGFGLGKDLASDALAAPFGLGADGTVNGVDGGDVAATFLVAHPAAGGETMLPQFLPGWLATGDASVAPKVLATNPGGAAVALFEKGALAQGSGAVAVFSDNGSFMDDVVGAPTPAAQHVIVATVLHVSGK